MTTINNNYIFIVEDEEEEESKVMDIINLSAVLIGLLIGYFGMNYEKLGPGDFYKSENFEYYIIFFSFVIIGCVSIYYYKYE
tara:strand:+ start:146 stop:391 length:246 start_codon:yes stop_codon:yes gene_type:complete